MRFKNWNDLRFLLAIKRGQTLNRAARALLVDDTTVSRRLAALQMAFGQELVQRRGDGKCVLTEAGERIAREAEAMEVHFHAICTSEGDRGNSIAGTVRITSVPILTNRLLAVAANDLLVKHPLLSIELVPESRELNLTHREADIAVRLARPLRGGLNTKARLIGSLTYAAYIPATASAHQAAHLPWVTFEEAMAYLPQARWIESVTTGISQRVSGLRVHDAETALEAVAAGHGKTLLPTIIAERDKRLRRITLRHVPAFPTREVWLLAHKDQMQLGRVATAIRWIEKIVNDARNAQG
jgi:DNA-binding transcriptional LysR family regulator